MTVNIIFPVNNKGGVGKTSVLADLSAVLAQRYDVGIVDMDYQTSLAKTLLKRDDLGWQPMAFYRSLSPQTTTLIQGGFFSFSNALSMMQLRVEPTRADVAVFPVGSLYRVPESRKTLEHILEGMMGRLLVVDLPPIADPHLILDHTIGPMLDIFKRDVQLFPIIVSTPDHRVFVDGLHEFAVIEDYLRNRGVDAIYPYVVLNKLPLERTHIGDDKVQTTFVNIDPAMSTKFAELGVLYVSHRFNHSRLNHVNRKFTWNGTRFRTGVIPYVDTISDGRFALFLEEQPRISLFPHLASIVAAHNFPVDQMGMNAEEGMYARTLWEIAHYILAHTNLHPRKNYTKQHTLFETAGVLNATVDELRQFVHRLYNEGRLEYSRNITSDMFLGASSLYETLGLPKVLSVESLTDVVYATQIHFLPNYKIDRREIETNLRGIREGEYTNEDSVAIYSDRENELLEVEYAHRDPTRFVVRIPRTMHLVELTQLQPAEYLSRFEIFLHHLNKSLKGQSAEVVH